MTTTTMEAPTMPSILASRLTIGISALVVVIGSLLPWAQAFGVSAYGMSGDGRFTIALGGMIAILAASSWIDDRLVSVSVGIMAGLFGLGVMVIASYNWWQVQGTIFSPGVGLVLAGLGSIGMFVGAILALVRR